MLLQHTAGPSLCHTASLLVLLLLLLQFLLPLLLLQLQAEDTG